MSKTLENILNSLPAARREKITKRTEALIQEEMNLQEVRRLRQKTQDQLAELLQKRQDEISRFERREDCLISTLSDYIEALGGHLKLVAEFDDSPPIVLNRLKPRANNTRHSS